MFFRPLRYRISPFEVESVLVEHPSVAESAVVAKPDSVVKLTYIFTCMYDVLMSLNASTCM